MIDTESLANNLRNKITNIDVAARTLTNSDFAQVWPVENYILSLEEALEVAKALAARLKD